MLRVTRGKEQAHDLHRRQATSCSKAISRPDDPLSATEIADERTKPQPRPSLLKQRRR